MCPQVLGDLPEGAGREECIWIGLVEDQDDCNLTVLKEGEMRRQVAGWLRKGVGGYESRLSCWGAVREGPGKGTEKNLGLERDIQSIEPGRRGQESCVGGGIRLMCRRGPPPWRRSYQVFP